MKASIISIGNSKGIRIPKTFLEELKIGKEVEIHIENKSLVIQPIRSKSRENWAKIFKKMAEQGEDKLLISDSLDIDELDQEWK